MRHHQLLLGGSSLILATAAGCGSSGAATTSDAGVAQDGGEGGASTVIGAACIPPQELSTTFLGFDYHEVTVDERNIACGSGVCLVNHYQGRVTCPYGQNQAADGPYGTTGGSASCGGASASSICCTPGADQAVVASQDVGSSAPMHSQVLPGCSDRPSAKAVTCSCRCANAAGKTDDGAQYCSCPGGFACTQVVPELTAGDPLAGAYCIPNGSAYDAPTSCQSARCDPAKSDCPPPATGTKAAAGSGPEATYFLTSVHGAGGSCQPLVLPTDASGKATCVVLAALQAGQSCSGTPGLTVPDPAVAASVQQSLQTTMPLNLCEIPQLTAPCDTGSQPGWCYVTGMNAPPGCASTITFASGLPPLGSSAILGCY